MRVAEYLIKKLESIGVEKIFGVQNEFNRSIIEVIESNKNVDLIFSTTPLNAGYAADGYARQKGYGAVVSSYGNDEMNAFNAFSVSYGENVPVIHVVGTPMAEEVSYIYQEVFKSISEATAFLNRDNATIEIDRVLRVFVKEKKPVYIAIPIDVAELEISIKKVDYSWNTDSEALNVVANLISEKIRKSKKPMIVGDVLIKRFEAIREYQNFVENSGILTTNLLGGINLIDSGLKNNLGTYFSKYHNQRVLKNVEESDFILKVGCVYSGIYPYKLELPQKFNSEAIIQGTYAIVDGIKYNDIKMSDLLALLAEKVINRDFEIDEEVKDYENLALSTNRLDYDFVFSKLNEFLTEEYILLVDSSLLRFGLLSKDFPKGANVIFQTTTSCGWATSASLGVALANPSKKVVLLTDKDSHQTAVMELENILKVANPPIIIVLNDKNLKETGQNEHKSLININFSKLSRAFEGDIWATQVESSEDFYRSLKVTQIMRKLCYIEACIDMDEPWGLYEKVSEDFRQELRKRISKMNTNLDKIKLSEDSMNFETKVHESLKD